jgi:hypothetical protein
MLDRPKAPKTITLDTRVKKLKFGKGNISRTLDVGRYFIDQMLDFLNGKAMPARDRLLWIVNEMKELATAPTFTEKIRGPVMIGSELNPELAEVAPEKYARFRELLSRAGRLNEELARYRFTPVIQGFGEAPFTVAWHRDWRNEIDHMKPPDRLWEGQNLELILNIARAGQLWRLRFCRQCQKWMFAMRSSQQFCSFKCQQKHYSQTDSFKANRRQYMKKRYQEDNAKSTK